MINLFLFILAFKDKVLYYTIFDEIKKDFLNKGLTLDQLEERIELMETKVNLNKIKKIRVRSSNVMATYSGTTCGTQVRLKLI